MDNSESTQKSIAAIRARRPIKLYVVLSLFILTGVWIVYSNNLDGPFVFDDHHNIVANHNIQITELSPGSLLSAVTGNPTPRPLAYLSFALNYYFGGLDVHGFHVANNLIHAFNGLLVFLLMGLILSIPEIQKTLGNDLKERAHWIAFAGALFFALHPVQTQAVTYIVQRMASMCATFYLAALILYLQGRLSASIRTRYGMWLVSMVLWFVALGIKQLAVTLPIAVILFEWLLFRDADLRWLVKQTKLILIAIAAMCMVVFLFKGADFFKLFTRGFSKREFTLIERLLTEGRIVFHYISLIILPLPSRLTLVYDFPLSTSLIHPISTLVCWAGIMGLIAGSIIMARKHILISLSVLWFFLHLAVESTIIPLELVYEHRLYLPLVGVSLLVSVVLFQFIRNWVACLCIIGILSFSLGFGTYIRNTTWGDAISLWSDNIAKQPSEPRGYFNLARQYGQENDNDAAKKLLEKSLQVDARFYPAILRLGIIYESEGNLDLAMRNFEKVISVKEPDFRELGKSGLGDAYLGLGRIHNQKREYLVAKEYLDRSIELNPNNPTTFVARAKTNANLDLPLETISDYLIALRLAPNSPEANNNFAWLLSTYHDEKIARPDQAIKHARLACELTEWKNYLAIATLAAAHARNGDFGKAIEFQEKAIKLAPSNKQTQQKARLKLFKSGEPYRITTK